MRVAVGALHTNHIGAKSVAADTWLSFSHVQDSADLDSSGWPLVFCCSKWLYVTLMRSVKPKYRPWSDDGIYELVYDGSSNVQI